MSVLAICQNATAMLVGERPPAFYSSNDELPVEISSIANEAAADIIKKHEWSMLTRKWSEAGDGVKTNFSFPSDYDRMCLSTRVRVGDSVIERAADIGSFENLNGDWGNIWFPMSGGVEFTTLVGDGEVVSYTYQSCFYATNQNGAPKRAFDADTDDFRLNGRLLTLGIIWRWRALKRQDYQEDMQNYEVAMSEQMARDGGARMIRSGGDLRGDFVTPWPWSLG